MTADLIRHLSLFLLVVAMLMPGIAALRAIVLAAGVLMVVQNGFLAYDGVGLVWSVALVVVVAAQLALHYRRRSGEPLRGEELLFQEKIVPSLSAAQARRLIAAGQWRDVAAGTALTRQGEIVRELAFISRGTVDIVVDGHKVSECASGTLIGEIALSTGEAATATAVCASPVRYLGFETGRLYTVLDRQIELQEALQLAIQRSLREKIHRLNYSAAHTTAGAAAP
jgi:hypothetical protein